MIESSLISSISIDGLLAARDASQETFAKIRDMLREADESMTLFDVVLPEVNVSFGGDYRSLRDVDYADAVRREVDRLIWLRIFAATNIEVLMDAKTRNELHKKLHRSALDLRADQGLPEVTRENIESTWQSVTGRAREFFENCVESVYRSLSWDHKTNTPGLIGELLIIRGAFYSWAKRFQGSGVSISHHDALEDMERVLALVDGQPPPTYEHGLRSMKQVQYGEWTQVPYATRPLMEIKVHRVGTTHVRILNSEHVKVMNAIMAKRFPGAIGTGDRRKNRRTA